MRNFFNRPHPWLMQGVGGFIALVVVIIIGVFSYGKIANSASDQGTRLYSVPQSGAMGDSSAMGGSTPTVNSSNNGAAVKSGPGGTKIYTVKMQPGPNGTFVFAPSSLTIHVHDTVQWQDVNSVPHNIIGLGSAAKLIDRTTINTQPYTARFTAAGTYHYECQVHLPTMVAAITVR